jgi:diguanylate cyclase (GGDEF)-like protein
MAPGRRTECLDDSLEDTNVLDATGRRVSRKPHRPGTRLADWSGLAQRSAGRYGPCVREPMAVLGGGVGRVLLVFAGVAGAAGVVLATGGGRPVWVMLLVCGAERVVAGRRHRRELADALRLAHVDDLTGLANRRALYAAVSEALAGAGAVGLVLVDLDDFKAVNDTHGHSAGDAVLRAVAARLAEAAGDEDGLVARLGGDEFAVLTGHQDPACLRELGRRIRAAMSEPVRVGGAPLRVGASVGTTTRVQRDRVPTDLLTRADLAMYLTKTTRRSVADRLKAGHL